LCAFASMYSSFPQTWHWVLDKTIPGSEIRFGFQSDVVFGTQFRFPESFSRKPSAMSAGTSCMHVFMYAHTAPPGIGLPSIPALLKKL